MYRFLVKLMLLAAFAEFGISVVTSGNCRSRECMSRLEQKTRQALKIDWKPVSIFPEEAKRFR